MDDDRRDAGESRVARRLGSKLEAQVVDEAAAAHREQDPTALEGAQDLAIQRLEVVGALAVGAEDGVAGAEAPAIGLTAAGDPFERPARSAKAPAR